MIGGSKSKYRASNPDHEVFFNANLFTTEDGKIWYGDIDYTIDKTTLEKVATAINRELYLLRELDGRFENETLTKDQIKKKAIKVINPVTF
jgi:hypothetical protein